MYRTVSAAFWTDKEVKKLTPDCKAVLLYLITNPHSHVSGIYYLNLAYAQADLGMTAGTVSRHLDTLSIPYPKQFCMIDIEKSVVWVKKMFFHQGMNDKTIRSAARHLMEDVHESVLCKPFLDAYPIVKTHIPVWGIDRLSGFGIPEQDPEQTPEQKAGESVSTSKAKKFGTVYTSEFEEFWKVYPNKTGKGDAFKIWEKNGRPPVEQIVAKVTAMANCVRWKEDDGKWIPNPATWLNQKRWDDEIPPMVKTAKLVL